MKKFKFAVKLNCIIVLIFGCLHNILRCLYLAIPAVEEFFRTSTPLKYFAESFLGMSDIAIGGFFLSFLFTLFNAIVVSALYKDVKSRISAWTMFVFLVALYLYLGYLYPYSTLIFALFGVANVVMLLTTKNMYDVCMKDFAKADEDYHNSKTHLNVYDTQTIIQFKFVKHLVLAFLYALFCLSQLAFCVHMIKTDFGELALTGEDFVKYIYSDFYAFSFVKSPFAVLASLALVVGIAVVYKSIIKTLTSLFLVVYSADICFIVPANVYDCSLKSTYITAAIAIIVIFFYFFYLINYVLNKSGYKSDDEIIYHKFTAFMQLMLCSFYTFIALYFSAYCFANTLRSIFIIESDFINGLVTSWGLSIMMVTLFFAILIMIAYKSLSVSLTSWSFLALMVVILFVQGVEGVAGAIFYFALFLGSLFMTLSVLKYIQLSLEQYVLSIKMTVEKVTEQQT